MNPNYAHLDGYILEQQIASLLLYQSIFENEIGQAFVNLLVTINKAKQEGIKNIYCLKAYGIWFKLLAKHEHNWSDFIIQQILINDNLFSQKVQIKPLTKLVEPLLIAAKYDLNILENIANFPLQIISEWVADSTDINSLPIFWDMPLTNKTFFDKLRPWEEQLDKLANYYQNFGVGIFAQYKAFCWQNQQLIGISHPDPIQLHQIIGYELQKETLVKNTKFLLRGYPCLHVLLYGSRGSGKSSLVKALLNQYYQQGLRLIEVSKSELKDLSIIIEQLRDIPQKFIIFVDDLSFEEDDEKFKALKVILEGSVTAKAQNIVVYATSNRRHLIREFFGDRPRPSEGEEVHAWDTLQEKLSFSDRFGLTLTFEPVSQDTYLDIVNNLAQQEKIPLEGEELEKLAKQWAIRHNGRSGRTARQFIDFLQSELNSNIKPS